MNSRNKRLAAKISHSTAFHIQANPVYYTQILKLAIGTEPAKLENCSRMFQSSRLHPYCLGTKVLNNLELWASCGFIDFRLFVELLKFLSLGGLEYQ